MRQCNAMQWRKLIPSIKWWEAEDPNPTSKRRCWCRGTTQAVLTECMLWHMLAWWPNTSRETAWATSPVCGNIIIKLELNDLRWSSAEMSKTYLDNKPCRIGEAAAKKQEGASPPVATTLITCVIICIIIDVGDMMTNVESFPSVNTRNYYSPNAQNCPHYRYSPCPSLQAHFFDPTIHN